MKATPKPRSIILKLLSAAEQGFAAAEIVRACQLLGASANSARVALARLCETGMLECPERGHYQLGPAARRLAADVARWRSGEQRLRQWRGGWVLVHTGALGRCDRAELRVRRRALKLLGLRELERGLQIRPDNLAGAVAAVRQRLYDLGLSTDAAVFASDSLDPQRITAAMRLWDCAALSQHYHDQARSLNRWLRQAATLDLDEAARQSWQLGDQAIRDLIYDPLLPAEWIDADLRARHTAAVIRFDQVGQRIWRTPVDSGNPLAEAAGLAEFTAPAAA